MSDTAISSSATAEVTPATLDGARATLVAGLRHAGVEVEHAQRAFVAPYSSHDAMVAFYNARGVQQGIARSIELLEALAATA